jgi:hypothetical protein
VAKKTGLVFGWTPDNKAIRQRSIRLTSGVAAADVDLAMLRRLLLAHELLIAPTGEPGKEIHWVLDARQQSIVQRLLPQPIELTEATLPRYERADGVFVTAAIPLSGAVNAREVRSGLSRLVTPMNIGSVTEFSDGAGVLITDFAPAVCAAYRLVRQLEAQAAAAPRRITRLVALQHADAAETARLLTEALAPFTAPAPGAPAAQAPDSTGPRVVVDARSNKLLVTGFPAQVEQVQELIAGLDVPAAPR